MGYDLHITRKQSWDDADVIEPAEWLAAVATVGGFSPVTQSQVGDSVLNLPPEWHSQRWNEHPEVPGAGPRFRLTSGSVTLGGGDTATLHIAFKLADVLGARIIGDEGEAYDLGYISGPRDEAGWKTKNPFTGEPIYSERVGVLESHGSEWHLVTSKRSANPASTGVIGRVRSFFTS